MSRLLSPLSSRLSPLSSPLSPLSRLFRLAPLALALSVAAACSSPTEVTLVEPTALALYIGDVRVTRTSSLALLPGTELQFTVRLTDANGRAVTGLRPTLVSRNIQSLTMDSIGVIRVVGRGASWIVGSILTPARAVLADSTLVNVVCTILQQPAIALTVVDSATGQSALLRSINISIRSGLLRDTVFVPSLSSGSPPFTVGLAYERPGSYDLTVSATGYREWTRNGVVVASDLCHVVTVPLTAKLQPF